MKRIGIALGADRLVATLPGGRRLETAEIADLTKVLEDLKQAAELPLARVTVALLPPLVDLRRISLPPLQPDEHRRVIARDVDRYFIGTRELQIVGSDAPFAAVAAAQLIDALEAAVAGVGWVLDAIIPAHVAWASAVREGALIARLPQGIELLRVERRRIVERSRVRSAESAGQATEIEPFAVAADQATCMRTRSLELLSETRRAQRQRANRRFAALLSAAAGLCLVLAAGVDYWGMNRELAALRTRRAAIAPQLARAMRTRDSLTAVSSVVTTLGTLDANLPTWSGFFTDLADYLPHDAHLDAFRAVGDSVAMVGEAHEAASVFQGLERMPRLSSVRADGAIRQDVTPTGVVREHFGVSARWSTP